MKSEHVVMADRQPRTLIVSRSAPPGVSGSAHVLAALLEQDNGRTLVAVGGRSPARNRQAQRRGLYLLPTELSLFGRGARFLAPLKQLLSPYAVRRISDVARRERADRIVAVFPDAFYCAAALGASRKLKIPIDFWFHNTYADNRTGLPGVYARNLEAQMVASGGRVFFISDALREQFSVRYPDQANRFHTLRHPVPNVMNSTQTVRGFRGPIVHATLMGNINESNLDATTRMIRALAGHPSIRLRLCTPVPRMLLSARGVVLEHVDFRGYLPSEELERLMDDTDLFLLPHGLTGSYSSEEYRTIFPTRAAHYLGRGRPMLAHCPAESGLYKFLSSRDCAVCVTSPNDEDLVAAFEGMLESPELQQRVAENALQAATLFHPEAVLAQLRDSRVPSID